MTEYHTIQREIGIDAGHRVPDHGSKCKNLHGHRYTIRAYCEGPLFKLGEQTGMVLDFGFLKEEMMAEIDVPCDHGMIFWRGDELMCKMFEPRSGDFEAGWVDDIAALNTGGWWDFIDADIKSAGYSSRTARGGTKVYIVPFVPTAENLAHHWFKRLDPRVDARSDFLAFLTKVRVEETPNCWAEYERPCFKELTVHT